MSDFTEGGDYSGLNIDASMFGGPSGNEESTESQLKRIMEQIDKLPKVLKEITKTVTKSSKIINDVLSYLKLKEEEDKKKAKKEKELRSEIGNVDYSSHKIKWCKYENTLILSNKNCLVLKKIKKITNK